MKLHLFSPTYGVDIKNLAVTNLAGHVAPTGETRNTQKVLMRKSERRRRRKWNMWCAAVMRVYAILSCTKKAKNLLILGLGV